MGKLSLTSFNAVPSCLHLNTDFFYLRLYQYIHGANLNSSKLDMTAPVLTSITPSTHGSMYLVKYYLQPKYEKMTPKPYPELNLQVDKMKSHCIAVRKFSGYAKDDNISQEFQALLNSLEKSVARKKVVPVSKSSYGIAQYDAPFRPVGRVNEVWIDVSGYGAEGCPQN